MRRWTRIDVKDVRAKFPARKHIDHYCVGGALIGYLEFLRTGKRTSRYFVRYPDERALGHALQQANPHLDQGDVAYEYAYKIIRANDTQRTYAGAWRVLDRALTWGWQ